jgi:predicted DNA-binding protein (MmcQ/YjbR family)
MDELVLLTRLRQVCLGFPEVRETVKWGHPTFEAGKKMFAVLDHYGGRPCLAFRAHPERLEKLLTDERFVEAPYAARHGWVCLHADLQIDWPEVAELLRDSYRLVALKRMLAALDIPSKVQDQPETRPSKRLRGGGRARQVTSGPQGAS